MGITIPCTEEEAGNLTEIKTTGSGIISILQQSQKQYSWISRAVSHRCSVHPRPQQYGRMLREAIDYCPSPIWYQLIGFLHSSLLNVYVPVNLWKHKVHCSLFHLFSSVKLNFNYTFKLIFGSFMVFIYDEFTWLYVWQQTIPEFGNQGRDF